MDTQREWERRKGERNRWYQRFTLFRMMGPNRSILGAQNEERKREGKDPVNHLNGSWHAQAKKGEWRDRAAAWDLYINEQDEAAWLERRKSQREKEWRVSEKLADRAESMLQFPIMRRTVQEVCECGEPSVTIIEPVDWNARDAVAFAKAASELARLSAEMEKAVESEHVVRVIGGVNLDEL